MKLIVQDDSGNEVFHLFFYSDKAAIPPEFDCFKQRKIYDGSEAPAGLWIKFRQWKEAVRELRQMLESAELWPIA